MSTKHYFFLLFCSFSLGGCTASVDAEPRTLADLVESIRSACETAASCGGPQGDCDDQPELVDSFTRMSNGTEECDTLIYEEFVDYNHCLAQLTCEVFNTDTSCDDMVAQAQVDAACAP